MGPRRRQPRPRQAIAARPWWKPSPGASIWVMAAHEIEGRTCVVTGAGGFIGLALARRLSGDGARVVGLDVDWSARDRIAAAGARFERCDTTDGASLGEALDGAELVVHAAARVSDWGAMDDFVRVNVEGTRNVLEAAHEAGAGRVVHISSVAIWGYEHRRELDEDAPARPCGIPYID